MPGNISVTLGIQAGFKKMYSRIDEEPLGNHLKSENNSPRARFSIAQNAQVFFSGHLVAVQLEIKDQ